MIPIRLQRVSKRLGSTLAVDDVELTIESGELFFLLGPSGCGKTTLLNLIAGLIEPTSGKILFGKRDVTAVPTNQRNAVMCFQSYALWPHLSVLENIRFGLQVRRLDSAEQERRIGEALELVQMQSYRDRKPAELSGGQQQRVAIARAIAVKPDCLLLDEPLSNLDTRLRQEMRGEIRSICRATGLTTLYVTHDQKEALSIADRIAIMKSGRVVQVGTPHELYTAPTSSFVAEFLGQANLIPGRIVGRAPLGPDAASQAPPSGLESRSQAPLGPDAALQAPPSGLERINVATSLGELIAFSRKVLPAGVSEVTLSIRPEQIRVASAGTAESGREQPVRAQLLESSFLGDCSEHRLRAGELELRMQSVPPRLDLPGDVVLNLAPEEFVVLSEAG